MSRIALSNLTREPDGLYYVSLDIDGETFTTFVDTGSDTLAVPHADCDSCGKSHARWRPRGPREAREDAAYVEGSALSLDVHRARVSIDGIELADYKVGAIVNETALFRTQTADGVLGAHGAFARAVTAFSLCYANGGMDLGMPADAATYAWLPTVSSNCYALALETVQGVEARSVRAIVDSGNSELVLPQRFASATRNKGLCVVAFAGAPPVPMRPCVSPNEIRYDPDPAASVLLGAPFLRSMPRVAFTATHVGLGFDADSSCPAAPRGARNVVAVEEQASAAFVVLAYIACLWICYAAFLRPPRPSA